MSADPGGATRGPAPSTPPVSRTDGARAPARPGEARFCTEHSLAAGEPLSGWGAHPARNVVIRWPRARWRHSLRIAGGMGPALEAAIERVVAAGWRVNLIDRKGDDGAPRAFLMPDALAFDVAPEALPALLDAVPGGALGRFGPRPIAAPLVLCCTHGKHDRCCARWGFAAYKALAAEAERRDRLRLGGFDVWECTHLGGCRLAAGVLTLPAMRKHGRLDPADAAPLLAAGAEGRPHLPAHREACHLEPAAQVAEVAALRAIAPTGPHAPARVAALGADRFAEAVAGRVAEVACHPGAVRAYGACDDLLAAAPLEPKRVRRGEVLSVTPDKETTP